MFQNIGMIKFQFFPLVYVQDGICKIFVGGKNSKEDPIKIFVQKVARGNAVQIMSNFPAKSLSIYRANFLITPFN